MVAKYDCIILGAGAAGMSAAIYCTRANVSCCILDNNLAGGRPTGYLEIENYLGLGKTTTSDMITRFLSHIESFGIPLIDCVDIEEVDLENKVIKTSDDTYEAKAIIIATGSRPRLLNVKGEKEFTGKGVHYCSICDGAFYKNKVVTVVGGGNSACEEALYLSDIAKFVHIIQDLPELTGDSKTVDLIKKKDNIQVTCNAKVLSIEGDKRVHAIYIERMIGDTKVVNDIPTDAVFPYIGMEANSDMFNVTKNHGFIVTDDFMETGVKGVFAAGDIRDKVLRQVVTAVADGAVAGVSVSRYLKSLN